MGADKKDHPKRHLAYQGGYNYNAFINSSAELHVLNHLWFNVLSMSRSAHHAEGTLLF
ncbi:hypothetical protein LIT38_26195 [Bacillus sp. CMF12]|uniref:hypothetical protein n=1 Tax=Bacillus sp. CMF12 TaxID=2884834 RepID=UPI00207A98A3|nr:hypothetical protein [Bacillus sp. CMF12]USK49936.1 hypothetical protein LIT38_26195 [Bacillus sp. CMF12]